MIVITRWNRLGTSLSNARRFQIRARNFKEFKRKAKLKIRMDVSDLTLAQFRPPGKPLFKPKGKDKEGMIWIRNLLSPEGHDFTSVDSNGFIQVVVLKPSWIIFLPQWRNKPTTLKKKIQTAYDNYIDNINNHELKHKNAYEKSFKDLVKKLEKETKLKKADFINKVAAWHTKYIKIEKMLHVIY